MSQIDFVDSTLRDAPQSLWGLRMNTAMACHAASSFNRAGFKAVDVAGAQHFVFLIRNFHENPWDRIRYLASKIDSTPLNLMILGNTFTTFRPMLGPIIGLWLERSYANGIKRIQAMEASNNFENITEAIKYARDVGMEVVIALSFSLSPAHTDEYFGQKARDIARLKPDVVYLKDQGGLLTPERIKTLIPTIQESINGLPLEIHSHCATGLAPICYLEAVKLGVKTIHTAIGPLANGSSLPSAENMVKNLEILGYETNLDKQALEEISEHFTFVAKREKLPVGRPVEYDVSQYQHQIPGGVISNLKRQLSEIRQEHRTDEVINEVTTVRKELGYPIMITPFSQYVVTQATLNIALGERYKAVPEEVMKLAMGCYGPQAGEVDQNVLDKIMSLPEAKQYIHWEIPRPSIGTLREQYGLNASDDELLLRILCQEQKDVEAMNAAGPAKTSYPSARKPIMGVIEDLIKRKGVCYAHLEKDGISISLRK